MIRSANTRVGHFRYEEKDCFPIPRFLIGHSCTSVTQPEHGWFIGLGVNCGVTIYCPWRIIADGRIAVTDTDQGRRFGLPQPIDVSTVAMQLLQGHKVVDVKIDGETSDLHIFFDHHRRIDIIINSSGYECWILTSPDGGALDRQKRLTSSLPDRLTCFSLVTPGSFFAGDL